METTMNYKSMKVDQLREIALQVLTEDEVTGMKKADLVEYLSQKSTTEAEFDLGFMTDNSETEEMETIQQYVPEYGSDEWQTYVMDQFKEGELFDGCPTAASLRRVAQQVLGPVVRAGAKEISVIPQGDERAVTVNYEVEIRWNLDFPIGYVNPEELDRYAQTRIFGGVADCIENSRCIFARHPAATAETKAMGRAFKTALGISVITREEKMSGYDNEGFTPSPSNPKGPVVTEQLLNMIKAKCNKLGIDPVELIKENSEQFSSEKLAELTQEEGRELFKLINQKQ